MPKRDDIRNIAIIAHIDHGKTTLTDGLLRQSGVFAEHAEVVERVLDSEDQERERGITIRGKHASVSYQGTTINIMDTPGHSDFGAEVQRSLEAVNGVLLLVDASEGPLPQTRYTLRKALEKQLPVILVINKVDRPDARISEVVDETYALFIDLDANDEQIEFPIVYTNAKAGTASLDAEKQTSGLQPLFETILTHIPPPEYQEGEVLQAQVINLDASPYVGRLALCYIRQGELSKNQTVAWAKLDGEIESAKITELLKTEGLERQPVDVGRAGELVTIAGIPDITIGETLTDPLNPQPLPAIQVDEPTIGMTIGANTSPLAGGSGKKLTARQIKDRLEQELVGNVSLKVLDTQRPDTWEVQGRGELQLAVLVESMRREGFELTVGKPKVVTHEENGKVMEPVERLSLDIPEDFMGVVTQALALRKGRMENMVNHGTGWVRLEYLVPARGLIGFRSEYLTETRGLGILHHVLDSYQPWAGEIKTRPTGSLVADRSGKSTTEALFRLQERGQLFIGPGEEVYEGMIVGENSRPGDLDMDASKAKKLTNIRSSTAEELVRLAPPTPMPLDKALEFIAEDECVEVTPDAVRLRKVVLQAGPRQKLARQAKSQANS